MKSPRAADPDAWLAAPQPTAELCRLYHGVDCRRGCTPQVELEHYNCPDPCPVYGKMIRAFRADVQAGRIPEVPRGDDEGEAVSGSVLPPTQNALDWILAHPELRQTCAARYVAVHAAPPFGVADADDDLSELLGRLGDDLTGLLVHQFP